MIRKCLFLLFCVAGTFVATAVPKAVFRLDSLDGAVDLDTCWQYKSGDDKAWANPNIDDSGWQKLNLNLIADIVEKSPGIKWFRLHLKVAPSLFNKTILFTVSQVGSSEIYLNGTLVQALGKVGNAQNEVPFNPTGMVYHMKLGGDTNQLIAVRFSTNSITDRKHFILPSFSMSLASVSEVNALTTVGLGTVKFSILLFAVFFTFSMFHLLLFLYYRKVKSNLYYSILAFLLALFWLYPAILHETHNPLFHGYVNEFNMLIYGPCFFLIVVLLYSIFDVKRTRFYWILVGLTVITEIAVFMPINIFFTAIVTQAISSSIQGLVIVIKAVRRKSPGAWIIASGFFVFLGVILVVFSTFAMQALFTSHAGFSITGKTGDTILLIWAFSVPTSMSIYLASDFARTNKHLVLQIQHVKQLSEQNIEKEREKQQIIERQKEVLEVKVKEATAEVSRQKDELAEKNKEITDSINYARRIQTSILPEDDLLRDSLGEYMIIYKPKDVVSGDFYWCHTSGDKAIFAVADCTGHGVPGAFMSMIGNSLLNEIVIGRQITEASKILDELRSNLIITLQQSAQHVTTRDGMDIALCVWDKKLNTLQFAGANNSLYLISKNIAVNGSVKESERVKLSNDHLLEILPDKQPIGYQEDKMNNPFTKNIIQLHPGDTIFIASDGYTDQFGGEKNKKFTSKRFRELIASLAGLPLAEQQRILDFTIEDWKKLETQTDDICVMGVRVV